MGPSIDVSAGVSPIPSGFIKHGNLCCPLRGKKIQEKQLYDPKHSGYPLVNIQKTMENHDF